MKICKNCKKEKNIDEFYGIQGECKECTRNRVRENRKNNLEYYREYDKKRRPCLTLEERLKFFETRKGSGNPAWKGNNAGYSAIHKWVQKNFKKLNRCENCGTTEKRMYHWANLSGEYKRAREDWKELCVSCHKLLDLNKKINDKNTSISNRIR